MWGWLVGTMALGVYFRSTRNKGTVIISSDNIWKLRDRGELKRFWAGGGSVVANMAAATSAGVASKGWREDDRYEPRLQKGLHNYFTGIHVKTQNCMRGWGSEIRAWNFSTIIVRQMFPPSSEWWLAMRPMSYIRFMHLATKCVLITPSPDEISPRS